MTPLEFAKREQEIREAASVFPDLEIGEAYKQYKEAKGEKPVYLNTSDPSIEKNKEIVLKVFRRPCNQEGCTGTQLLEGVCDSCVEGKKGYKSKWTCEECLYRELSKREYFDWYEELVKEE